MENPILQGEKEFLDPLSPTTPMGAKGVRNRMFLFIDRFQRNWVHWTRVLKRRIHLPWRKVPYTLATPPPTSPTQTPLGQRGREPNVFVYRPISTRLVSLDSGFEKENSSSVKKSSLPHPPPPLTSLPTTIFGGKGDEKPNVFVLRPISTRLVSLDSYFEKEIAASVKKSALKKCLIKTY